MRRVGFVRPEHERMGLTMKPVRRGRLQRQLSKRTRYSRLTPLNRRSENVRIEAIVVSKLEFGNVEHGYLALTLWKEPTPLS